jgi:PAS domain-containing protein
MRIFGYPAGDALGRSIIELIAPAGSEDDMRRALATVASGKVVHSEGLRRRTDGGMLFEATTDLERAVANLDALQIETVTRLSRAVEFRDEDTGHTPRASALWPRASRAARAWMPDGAL